MARKGDFGSVQPTKINASGRDLETDFLVPISESEFAVDKNCEVVS